jgi:excisionase family DNA binding protein
MNTEYQLPKDLTTIKAHAERLGVSYDALKMWVWSHNIPYMRLGHSRIFRVRDLAGYHPQGSRKANSTR